MMPNRILKESICTSDTLEALSPEEERLFYRLMVQCDDYGRFEARPAIVRARCFPLKVDSISDADVGQWISALERAGLLAVYSVGGRPYLQMVTWDRHQQRRAKVSKYPDPSASDATRNHVLADAGNSPRIRNRIRGIENRESVFEESRTGSKRTAKAAAGGPGVPTEKVVKQAGPSLAPLVDAFRGEGLPSPVFIGVEPKRAQALLGAYTPEQIVDCWHDYAQGRYGTPVDRSNLSFDYLTRNNRIGNWLSWKDAGSPSSNGGARQARNGDRSRDQSAAGANAEFADSDFVVTLT